ncbi:ABC transporter permease [Paenibacillus riograndensis]|uniref:Putative membrane protein n=1 Tax=Paenibacillus riograndensis SBR5 TaxID=1073571 RepID=A0A0E4CZ48_9BACL|nr:ABC transporter permease [Paenibacillus riograndensis]CQR58139.1 putative membrane protein [Paenibacillus riograndensis SBR5]
MTFFSIIRKNLLYNAKRYVSIYSVNTLIVTVLFMFGSLLYNSEILRQLGDTTLYDIVRVALIGVIVFSFVFITYSNFSFLKYRGKEFGMYILLGLTSRDLTKMLLLENAGIAGVSLGSGLITGVVFGKLFYMGLNQILLVNPIRFELTLESLLLSSGIFLMIFIFNFLLSMAYLRRVSVVDALQAAHSREPGKSSIAWGILASVLFAVSAVMLPGIMLERWFGGNSALIVVLIVLTLLCPYVIIGTVIAIMKSAIKRFRKLYNNNLLLLSNVSHRFLSYKTTMYIVTLLIAGALFFSGLTYAMYATTRENNRLDNPYDVMFVENHSINGFHEQEIEQVLKDNGIAVEQNQTLEYMEVPEFRNAKGVWQLWDTHTTVIGEHQFNQHMGTSYELAEDQALFVRVHKENMKFEMPDTIIAFMDPEHMNDGMHDYENKESLMQALESYPVKEYLEGNIREVTEPFANSLHTADVYYGQALVVDDRVYEQIRAAAGESQVKKLHLLKGDIDEQGFQALLHALQERNGLDASYWNANDQSAMKDADEQRATLEAFRPVYREELLRQELESSGTTFFIIMFLGALFAVASGAVLYHKVLSDIDQQLENMQSLKRIGVTAKELKQIVSKELGLVFFLPAVFGLGLGIYYFYFLFSNQPGILQLLGKAGLVALLFVALQIVFYFGSRKKYFAELGKQGILNG